MSVLRAFLAVFLVAVVLPSTARAQQAGAALPFDHAKHAGLFPSCTGCHEGARSAGRAMWPDPATCAECHDGAIRPRVSWAPPTQPRRSNLRFSHQTHPAFNAPASTACTACHAQAGVRVVTVSRAVVQNCLDCHRIQSPHLSADAACSTCHVPLSEAARLTRADVARFPAPASHQSPEFRTQHGAQAGVSGIASCATCHARDFCASCHVNAPELSSIRALAPDPRSLAIAVTLVAPASHRAEDFETRHGSSARKTAAQCATCHTRESCLTCHVANPRIAGALSPAGPGRAAGAQVTRSAPASHVTGFRDRHAAQAEATPGACATCHARSQCMECHRPAAASGPGGYHPNGFLERHPAAAYARETSCSDCHNSQVFCTSCHVSAGFKARSLLGGGYHDAKKFFLLGHGPAARQGLENCVSCHAERDCLTCHSSQGGRRFNPHGADFNASRLREKNPEMCTVCHGVNIPGAP
jgi:hypothetical protein